MGFSALSSFSSVSLLFFSMRQFGSLAENMAKT